MVSLYYSTKKDENILKAIQSFQFAINSPLYLTTPEKISCNRGASKSLSLTEDLVQVFTGDISSEDYPTILRRLLFQLTAVLYLMIGIACNSQLILNFSFTSGSNDRAQQFLSSFS